MQGFPLIKNHKISPAPKDSPDQNAIYIHGRLEKCISQPSPYSYLLYPALKLGTAEWHYNTISSGPTKF